MDSPQPHSPPPPPEPRSSGQSPPEPAGAPPSSTWAAPTPPPTHPAQPSSQPATCYRHPDRTTRLSCSSCGRPICVDCTRQASVGQKCPECAAPSGRNRVITASQIREATTGLAGAPVTRVILYVTIAIGVLAYVARPAWNSLAALLIDDVGRVAAGEVWRTVSAALLHSPRSLFHLGFNMYALYAFGPQLERRFGSLPFGLFYVASAAAGGLAFQLANDSGRALGASGAIFGLFGAYVTSAYLSRHTPAGRAGLNQLVPLLLLNLALPVIIPGIAWEAHLGGLAAGALMVVAWRRVAEETDRPSPTLVRALVAGAVLVACLGVLLVL